MTRAEALGRGRARLAAASPSISAASSPALPEASATPSLDAALILASLLGLRRETLLTRSEVEVEASVLRRFDEAIERRARGRPVAYITGEKEFYGRIFAVSEAVLVPRPETELLVELALEEGDRLAALSGRPPRLHECCVGSGAVILSIAAERPSWIVSASDISCAALEVVAHNASRLLPPDREGGAPSLTESDLLALPTGSAGPEGPFDLILANPPYVESALARDLSGRWGEPLLALDGGADGLELCRRLVPEAAARLTPGGLLLVEADGPQAPLLRALFEASGLVGLRSARDLAGIERVSIGVHP